MKIKFLQFCLVGQATFSVSLNSMLPRVRIADNTLKIICCFAVSTPITSSAVWNKIVSHVFSVVFLYHFNWVSHINLASSYRKHYLIKKVRSGVSRVLACFYHIENLKTVALSFTKYVELSYQRTLVAKKSFLSSLLSVVYTSLWFK